MEPLKRVYFFPTNDDGDETGEAIPVELKADGKVDLSKLPEKERTYLESCNLPNEMHTGFVSYWEGERYLKALLNTPSQTMHFRRNPTPASEQYAELRKPNR